MRTAVTAWSTLLLTSALVAGCGQGPTGSTPASSIPAMSASASACDESTIGAVEAVVGKQLAAFRAGDFDAAFALASSQFQSFSSPQALRDLIRDGRHEEVAHSVSHEFTECRQPAPDQAVASVTVTGANGRSVLLVYQFVRENDEWRILQSAPMGDHVGGTTSVPTAGQSV